MGSAAVDVAAVVEGAKCKHHIDCNPRRWGCYKHYKSKSEDDSRCRALGCPIGRSAWEWAGQSTGRTSREAGASAGEVEGRPIAPFWRVVAASPSLQVRVDEQSVWVVAGPRSSFAEGGQAEKCKKAEDPLGYVMVQLEAAAVG